MRPGQYIRSADGRFKAVLQGDGNFVVYDVSKALWSSQTAGTGTDRLVLQTDGNLVCYAGSRATWNAQTAGRDSDRLIMQGDGNLVLYGSSAWWNSRAAAGGGSGSGASFTGYPYPNADPNQIDPWRFYYRNCTSYCAWWLNASGVAFSNYMTGPNGRSGQFGHAYTWDNNAGTIGFPVSSTPTVGSIAVWEPTSPSSVGHVAVVTNVNSDGTIAVAEYNQRFDYQYGTRPNAPRAPSYIRFPIR